MSERRYTVAEIDSLRHAHEMKYLYGSYAGPRNNQCSRSYSPVEKDTVVEQWVRTSMLAGHTADDLIASESVPMYSERETPSTEGQ